MTLSLSHYLIVGAIMFTIGLFGALTKRHAIAVIISIELMLNAVNINFIAFGKYMMGDAGEIMAVFVIALAAAEVAIGLAICVVLFRNRENIDLDRYNVLRF
jgi:NADH:ubiquinone oxidoreductase subunit K